MNTIALIDLNAALHRGALVYETAFQIERLRKNIALWINDMGVRVEFDPATPPGLQDYLLGATLGALDLGLVGAGLGLVAGAFLDEPTVGLFVGAVGGVVVGCVAGADRVSNGYRVRVTARSVGGRAVVTLGAI